MAYKENKMPFSFSKAKRAFPLILAFVWILILPTLAIAGEVRIKMVADQYFFKPKVIEVKKGDKVILEVESKMSQSPVFPMHSLSIPGYELRWELPKDKITLIEFTADKAGEFPFECDIYCGPEHPEMQGKLIVKP